MLVIVGILSFIFATALIILSIAILAEDEDIICLVPLLFGIGFIVVGILSCQRYVDGQANQIHKALIKSGYPTSNVVNVERGSVWISEGKCNYQFNYSKRSDQYKISETRNSNLGGGQYVISPKILERYAGICT